MSARLAHAFERELGAVLRESAEDADVPTVSKRVYKLAVPVAPNHVRQRLMNLGARSDRPREHHLGVGDIEGEDDRRASDRGRRERTQLGNSSVRCKNPSPMRSCTDIRRPSGVGIRLSSSAPKASR